MKRPIVETPPHVEMKDIKQCIVCGRWLAYPRRHVDTCAGPCYTALLRHQRGCAERESFQLPVFPDKNVGKDP